MKKMTFYELKDIISEHNKEYGIKQQYSDKNPLNCVVVFKNSNFNVEYSLEERSYRFRSDEKFFLPEMLGRSIFAHSIEGDDNIRLDWYLNEWDIDYCYVEENENDIVVN